MQTEPVRIGFIGAGKMARALGRLFVRAGHTVVFTNRSGANAISDLLGELGPAASHAGLSELKSCDVVFLTTRWAQSSEALAALGPVPGMVLVDTTNNHTNGVTHDIGARTSSEIVAEMRPEARWVKAFNHQLITLLDELTTASFSEPRAFFVSGDDPAAKRLVMNLVRAIEAEPIDAGGLLAGARIHGHRGLAGGRPALLSASEGHQLMASAGISERVSPQTAHSKV